MVVHDERLERYLLHTGMAPRGEGMFGMGHQHHLFIVKMYCLNIGVVYEAR